MRFALPAAALVSAITVSVWAQPDSPPLTATTRTAPLIIAALASGSPASAAAPPAPSFPASFVVELKSAPAPSTASGFEVAIIAALGALVVAVYNAWRMGSTERMKVQAARDTEDMKLRAAEGLQMVRQAFEAAQEEARRIGAQAKEDIARAYDREKHAAIQAYEKQKDEVNRILQSGQHNDKIALEMQALQLRADVSDAEAYMAVKRLNHERDLAQANLISTFFSKLLSESQRERDLALFAISAFVDPERLAQLAAGGEAVVSRESLSRLAARGTDEVAAVAQRVLNDGVAAFRSGIVRVYREGSAQMVANGFISQGDLVVTYPIVGKDEVFEVQWGQMVQGRKLSV
ncbi:hypothetical protein PEC18_31240 [Paucibacter sp. O1-1]|nr:hypothetical protein [Paucibacter sp. O1-1]MDA3830180.1 hypothetical protein [Paucibacter sp. O1-1]